IYQGRFREAVDLLRDGIAKDLAAGNTTGQATKSIALADAYAELGDRARAAAAVQAALALSRQDPVLAAAAELSFRLGKTVEARALVTELGARLPAPARAYGAI